MTVYFLSLGSNVAPEKYIPKCVKKLKAEFEIVRISTTYETPPVGPAGQSNFWNLALSIRSELPESTVRKRLLDIESRLGRRHTAENKFAPRTIDIDLLPKEGYREQAFVMVPLAEIHPDSLDPVTGKPFAELAETLEEDASKFKPVRLAGL